MVAHRHTLLAGVLLAVAVLAPTSAWYVSGSREAERRLRELEEQAVSGVRAAQAGAAARLEARLGALKAREAARPFYHYQNLFHDPRGAAQGLAVAPSPLAQGTADPLVWAHFQIDEHGAVSLPTVNERFPELSSDDGLSTFCDVLTQLQDGLVPTASDEPQRADADQDQVIVLDRRTWEQINLADSVYATLTGRTHASSAAPPGGVDTPSGTVAVRVGPMRWHTIVVGSGPTLAALRRVATPAGLRLQGFAIAPAAVTEWLGSSQRFVPVAPSGPDRISTPVADTGWYLLADAGTALRDARARGEQARAQFRRVFALAAGAILCAALAVFFIVVQTDRLARQRGAFAASAAHELKTPLAALRLHSEMLAEGLGSPATVTGSAGHIASEARRLGRVVANMLDLSRLERGATLAQPRPGDLAQAVTDAVARLEPALERTGLDLEVVIQDHLPAASFDPDALRQILDNLLDNADKHTRDASPRRCTVAVSDGGGELRVTVSDTGPGVPRRLRRRLFRPFARDADRTAGLGLGLALSRSLARAQGGELALAEGTTGAVFVLTVPVAAEAP